MVPPMGGPKRHDDLTQQKLVLAPEYGGDGGKTVGCACRSQALLQSSRPTGNRMISSSTTDSSFLQPTEGGRLSHSTDHGIESFASGRLQRGVPAFH